MYKEQYGEYAYYCYGVKGKSNDGKSVSHSPELLLVSVA